MNESEKRSASFDASASEAMILADGQTWYLRRPKFGMRPSIINGKVVAVAQVGEIANAVEYTQLLNDHFLSKTTSNPQWYSLIFGMAYILLSPNYDLSEEEFASLLAYFPEDESAESDSWFYDLLFFLIGLTRPSKDAPPKKP